MVSCGQEHSTPTFPCRIDMDQSQSVPCVAQGGTDRREVRSRSSHGTVNPRFPLRDVRTRIKVKNPASAAMTRAKEIEWQK